MHALDRRPTSPFWLLLLMLAAMVYSVSGPFTTAQAQEEPAAEAPAAAAAGGEAPAEGGGHQSKSTLWWLIETSGWIGAFLLAISIYFVATVVILFMEVREQNVSPPELIEQCEQLLAKRDFNSIYKIAKESSSELGQLISVGMTRLSSGLSDAVDAIDRQGEAIAVNNEKRISMLAVIGSLGPLIGLLGTLKGMIASFSVIAMSDQQLKASEVAGGISEALVLTFEGVGLSVPAIYFYALFKNRISVLGVESLNMADDFIRRVFAAAQKKPAAPTA